MFARVWRPKVGGTCNHLFPADQIDHHPPVDQGVVEAACGETVPRNRISQEEYSDTAVYCHGCLLRAGSAVRLHQPAAA